MAEDLSVGGSSRNEPRNGGNGGRGDPSRNVLDLVDAAIKRQDDLREADAAHNKEVASLRAEYDDKLRRAESERINAIRAVDVGAVNRAAEVASDASAALATSTANLADTLRTQVTDTAAAAATALATALNPILESISALQKAQYETQGGKQQVTESREGGASRGMWIGVAVAVVGLFFSTVIGAIALYFATKGP